MIEAEQREAGFPGKTLGQQIMIHAVSTKRSLCCPLDRLPYFVKQ